jgi:hypothetical protein
MYKAPFFARHIPGILLAACSLGSVVLLALALGVLPGGCNRNSIPDSMVERTGSTQVLSTGEDLLIGLLDELDAIANSAAQPAGHSDPGGLAGLLTNNPKDNRRLVVSAAASDTTFIYGEITPDGFGAVVTERHQYPKGLLLITVRKTHGKPQGRIVSETRKYISFADLRKDSAQQSNVTDVYGLSGDTIVTHVLRNGILETYTFRLPVVTRVVNPGDGSVRVTSRFGTAGAVVTEVRDGSGALIQLRKNNGLADGSVVNYTQYADSTWRSVRTVGQADGTVFREITSGP